MSEVAAPSATPASSAPSTSAPVASSAPAASPPGALPGSTVTSTDTAAPAAGTAGAANLPHRDESAPAEKPLEVQAEAKKYKFKGKVNGKDLEQELSDEELNLRLQKSYGAEEKFNEAANIRKQFQSFVTEFKKDPFSALKDPELAKHFGEVDLLQLAGQRLYDQITAEEAQKADPVKYELEQLRKFKAEQETKEAAAAEAKKKADEDTFYEQRRQVTEKAWVDELTKSGLAGNRHFILEMAKIGHEFLDNGLEPRPDHLVAELKLRLGEQKKAVMGGLKGKALLDFLGDDAVTEILNYKLEELKRGTPAQEPIKAPESAPKPATNDDKMPRFSRGLRQLRDFQSDD